MLVFYRETLAGRESLREVDEPKQDNHEHHDYCQSEADNYGVGEVAATPFFDDEWHDVQVFAAITVRIGPRNRARRVEAPVELHVFVLHLPQRVISVIGEKMSQWPKLQDEQHISGRIDSSLRRSAGILALCGEAIFVDDILAVLRFCVHISYHL